MEARRIGDTHHSTQRGPPLPLPLPHKPRLWKLREGASRDFQHMKDETAKYLEACQDKKYAQELLDMANKSRATPEEIKAVEKVKCMD